MSDDKNYKTEWSFSFEKIGDSINKMVGSIKVSDEEVKTAHYSEPLGNTASATIRLAFSVGEVVVKTIDEPDKLFEADLKYVGEIEYSVSGEEEKTIRLGQKRGDIVRPMKDALGWISNREDLRWEIGINPHVPVRLDIDGGVGATRLDLSGLHLTNLDIDGGVGETNVSLPATGTSYDVDIDSGVGGINVKIAEGAALKLDISGGVGGVNIQLPESAAASLRVTTGLGGVSIPARFARVKGGSDFISKSGVWETSGFALAQQQIVISYHGGVGGFKIS